MVDESWFKTERFQLWRQRKKFFIEKNYLHIGLFLLLTPSHEYTLVIFAYVEL